MESTTIATVAVKDYLYAVQIWMDKLKRLEEDIYLYVIVKSTEVISLSDNCGNNVLQQQQHLSELGRRLRNLQLAQRNFVDFINLKCKYRISQYV